MSSQNKSHLSCAELGWWAPLCGEGQGPGVTPEKTLGSWPCSSLWHGSWLQDCVLLLNIYWDLHLRNMQLPVYIVYFHEKCFLKASTHEGNIMKFSEPQNRWWMTTDAAQLRNTNFSGTEMQPGLYRRVLRGQRTFVMKWLPMESSPTKKQTDCRAPCPRLSDSDWFLLLGKEIDLKPGDCLWTGLSGCHHTTLIPHLHPGPRMTSADLKTQQGNSETSAEHIVNRKEALEVAQKTCCS